MNGKLRSRAGLELVVELLVILYAALLLGVTLTLRPHRHGDGHEYMIMGDALAYHFSPDITQGDIARELQRTKVHGLPLDFTPAVLHAWSEVMRKGAPWGDGLFRSKEGRYYSYHFWLYSALAAPLVRLLDAVGLDGFAAFQILNAILSIAVLGYIAFLHRRDATTRLFLAALFALGGSAFYLCWPHPEVFSYSLLYLGLLAAMDGHPHSSLVSIALASVQNPPVIFVLPCAALMLVADRSDATGPRERLRELRLPLLLSLAVFLAPFVFCRDHFSHLSLIASTSTSLANCNLARLRSFFFDLDQGMIVGVPGILLATFFFLGTRIVSGRGRLPRVDACDSLLLGTVVASLAFCSTTNWNSGQAVFMRYAFVVSAPLCIWVAVQIGRLEWRFQVVGVAAIVAVQLGVNLYFGFYQAGEFPQYVSHKAVALYVLSRFPRLYDPDPEIFAERTLHHEVWMSQLTAPIAIRSATGDLTKILVVRDRPTNLDALCPAGGQLVEVRTGAPASLSQASWQDGRYGYLSGRFACR